MLEAWFALHQRNVRWWIATIGITGALAVNLVGLNLPAVMGFSLALALNWLIFGLTDSMMTGARVMQEQQELIMRLMAELHARNLEPRDD